MIAKYNKEHDVSFRPLPGITYLKWFYIEFYGKVNNRFRPLPGNTYLKSKDLSLSKNLRNKFPSPPGEYLSQMWVWMIHAVHIVSFRPLPGNTYLKSYLRVVLRLQSGSFRPLPGNTYLK